MNPNFALALMEGLQRVNDRRTQWQILVHLKIVLKRNWSSKRRYYEGVRLNEEIKETIKMRLISMYEDCWQIFHKQFNDIFKVIAKDDYPTKYPALKQFILSLLNFLSSLSSEQLLSSQETLPYLSLIKRVFKDITQVRLSFSNSTFVDHMAEPVHFAKIIQ